MTPSCPEDVSLKRTVKAPKKKLTVSVLVDESEQRFAKELWLAIAVDLCSHPKLISMAMELDIDETHALGILVRMWLMTFKYAKDGDLWRDDEEATYRFVTIVSGYKGDPKRLVEVLRREKWLDEWLIHDWLDYVGAFLIRSYKTSRRPWLVQTWGKHGREYGIKHKQELEIGEPVDDLDEIIDATPTTGPPVDSNRVEAHKCRRGSRQEVPKNRSKRKQTPQEKPLDNPRSRNIRDEEHKALSPRALKNKNIQKTLKMGGLGEGDDAIETAQKVKNVAAVKNDGFFQFIKQGGQPESLNTAEFPLYKVAVEDVYLVYQKVLRFFGVFSLLQFKEKVAYCKVGDGG